jgi:5'-3' exonuclease
LYFDAFVFILKIKAKAFVFYMGIKVNIHHSRAVMLVDTSYIIHALSFTSLNEYSNHFDVEKDQEKLYKIDFSKDEDYLAIFKRIFLQNIMIMCKTYNVGKEAVYFAMDCSKKDIWRVSHYPLYKAHRMVREEKGFNNGPIFGWCINSLLPSLLDHGFGTMIRNKFAEGDDVVAVLKQHIRSIEPDRKIVIWANDRDLYQLVDNNTFFVNVQKEVLNSKIEGDGKDLALKLLLGDGGDNIPSTFNKVKGDKQLGRGFGHKTALMFRDDPVLLEEKFKMYPEAVKQFELNKLLIDFRNIPEEIANDIKAQFKNGKSS